ncbi:hypothetical protein VTK56DRAFT_2407 [Thermocarpiscus australiensis]
MDSPINLSLPPPWRVGQMGEEIAQEVIQELQNTPSLLDPQDGGDPVRPPSEERTQDLEVPVRISTERQNGREVRYTLTVERLIFTVDIPEYLESSDTGICYVIPYPSDEGKQKYPWDSIQYCKKRTSGLKPTTSVFLNHAPCQRATYTCTRVKACECNGLRSVFQLS